MSSDPITPLRKLNGYLDRRVRAVLALLVTTAVVGAWFVRGEIPDLLSSLSLFAWGYYFGQPQGSHS